MSVEFFSKEGTSYTPTYKNFYSDAITTTASIWTPASGKKAVITDLELYAAATGTIRIYLHSGGDITYTPVLAMEQQLVGSAVIRIPMETPLVNPYVNGITTIVGGANGRVYVCVRGFEI